MKRMLINAMQADHVRVAIVDGSQLVDLDIESPGQEQKKSNIYKGIITSIEPSLGAVFVNFGEDRHGFLPIKEISREYFINQEGAPPENADPKSILREGQPLVIQVEKEERGTKGAALTTFISLAGAFLVLMPNNPRAGGISRRIEGDERDHLRAIINKLEVPEGMGIIIRTAGVGRSQEELEWDLNVLLQYWEAIKQAATVKEAPYLIHQESNTIIRAIRDYLRQDIGEIIIDESGAYECARSYLSQLRPDFLDKVKLYQDTLPLLSRFQIEQQIESAYQREVRLPSGGSIVIDHSEALVAIDINSARATKGSNIEETALNTNLEAAEEIARQLRIRDIGGLIVIDFIDMTPTRNQRDVENCLRNALRQDRARIQLGRISRFGLMEMSRQRLRTSLTRASHIACPRCDGQGTIRGVESQAMSIIHIIQEQAARSSNLHFQAQLPVDVATYILNEKRDSIKEIEQHCRVRITVIPNELLESPQYQLKQVKCDIEALDQGKSIPSYKLTKTQKTEAHVPKAPSKTNEEPVINQFLSYDAPADGSGRKPTPQGSGLIKRLWSKMFGGDSTSAKKMRAKSTKRMPQTKGGADKRQTSSSTSARPPHQSSNTRSQSRTRRGTRGGQRRSNPNQAAPSRQHSDESPRRHSQSDPKSNKQTQTSQRTSTPSRDDTRPAEKRHDTTKRDTQQTERQHNTVPQGDSQPTERQHNAEPQRDSQPTERQHNTAPQRNSRPTERQHNTAPQRDSQPTERQHNTAPQRDSQPTERQHTTPIQDSNVTEQPRATAGTQHSPTPAQSKPVETAQPASKPAPQADTTEENKPATDQKSN